MKFTIFFILCIINMEAFDLKPWTKKVESLSEAEKNVIINKGTEAPFIGKYTNEKAVGVYTCKLCGTALYNSSDKFDSHCGWPSFDDAIENAVKRVPDSDGRRTEIVCSKCGAHLGHVFEGEGFTPKNSRHCVNSISLEFIKKQVQSKEILSYAYFAGGCFWGVEYYLRKLNGVKEVTSGFMGGEMKNPTYYDVVYKNTGHLEVVEVLYNKDEISYEEIAKMFFEIHDPTQINGQGPDIGEQYLSAVFVANANEREIIKKLIERLKDNGYRVATKILDKKEFYMADESHQNYYLKKGSRPYCHTYIKRF